MRCPHLDTRRGNTLRCTLPFWHQWWNPIHRLDVRDHGRMPRGVARRERRIAARRMDSRWL